MAETELTAKQLARRLSARDDGHDQFYSIERIRDGEFTRNIRRAQFFFATWVLGGVTLALAVIVAIDVWATYWPLPGAVCSGRSCGRALHHSGEILDWAKALINTLFGAALALALGSVYSPPDRRHQ